MFEVYRESSYDARYRVVYFTELNEHNKESEINHALAGQHFVDGFLKDDNKQQAKALIDNLLQRLNDGEPLTPEQFLAALRDHLA